MLIFISIWALILPCDLFQMSISYCDNSGQLRYMTSEECPYGINFGQSKPSCICINGAYRLWMDECIVYDGFMDGGCTTLKQGNSGVEGIRLGGSIESMTNSTAAIFGLEETDYQIWSTFEIGSSTKSLTDNFYVLNGRAFIEGKKKGENGIHICIERINRPKFCRYFRNQQNSSWKVGKEIQIRVAEYCESNGQELIPNSCYDTILPEDSECSLACGQKETREISDPPTPNVLDLRSEAIPPVLMKNEGRLDNDSVQAEIDVETWLDNDPAQAEITVDNDNVRSDTDCCGTSASANKIQGTNTWANRKLNHYAKLRQVKLAPKPNFKDIGNPNQYQNFALLKTMKKITCKSCPAQFISRKFLEQVVDLFFILHEDQSSHFHRMSTSKFEWIHQILEKCAQEIVSIPLYVESSTPGCEDSDSEYVQGVCISMSQNSSDCVNTPVKLGPEHSHFKFHYVIDGVWLILDLVHIVCFPYFDSSYRMFHAWQQHIEKLFTREIRKLWFNPGVKSTREYQNILAATAVTDIFNLEMCVESAYALNPILTRLIRPPAPVKLLRKRRTVSHTRVIPHLDVTCQKEEKDFRYPC